MHIDRESVVGAEYALAHEVKHHRIGKVHEAIELIDRQLLEQRGIGGLEVADQQSIDLDQIARVVDVALGVQTKRVVVLSIRRVEHCDQVNAPLSLATSRMLLLLLLLLFFVVVVVERLDLLEHVRAQVFVECVENEVNRNVCQVLAHFEIELLTAFVDLLQAAQVAIDRRRRREFRLVFASFRRRRRCRCVAR